MVLILPASCFILQMKKLRVSESLLFKMYINECQPGPECCSEAKGFAHSLKH